MNQQAANVIRAFLHGITGAGMFRRLDYPGAPVDFIDRRSLEEIVASGEFARYANLKATLDDRVSQPKRQPPEPLNR